MKRCNPPLLTQALLIISLFTSCGNSELPSGAIVTGDFDSGTWDDWTVEGDAFGPGPFEAQNLVEGVKGHGFKGGLANSNRNGPETTGRIVSPEFTIHKKYLNFLITGNGHYNVEDCNLRLLIDDQIVRYAAATRAPQVEWMSFDIEEFVGQAARVELADESEKLFLMADLIFQSDEMQLGAFRKSLRAEKQYLLLPVTKGAKQYRLRLEKEGDVTEQFVIEMSADEPDFWAFKDISRYQGKELTITGNSPIKPDGFELIYQADEVPGEENFYKEANRPQFHFTSKQGWINDPNGLIYHEGEWHLMYQHNPYGVIGSSKHWGLAISNDLVHWEERPSSVVPDDLGSNHSGGAVVDHFNHAGLQQGDEKTLIAFWTAAGHFTSPARRFTQCISYSNDRGRTWKKYPGNPIIGHIEGRNRDPNVIWHDQANRWVMSLFLDNNDYALLKSADLINWELIDKIKMPASECPDLLILPLNGDPNQKKWLFWGGNGNYVVGDFDGNRFTIEGDAQRTHHGNRYYAAMTFTNAPEGRTVQVGWLTNRTPFEHSNFLNQLSVPNELSLKTNREGVPVLFANPVKELEKLRSESFSVEAVDLISDKPFTPDFNQELADLEMEIYIGNAREIVLNIRGVQFIYDTEDKNLSYNIESQSVFGKSSEDKIPLETHNDNLTVRILIDRASVELFLNGGEKAVFISELLDPSNLSFTFEANGGSARINRLEMHTMLSAWKAK